MGLYVGVMSGTSLDAIDVALIETSRHSPPRLIAHHSSPFRETLHTSLKKLIVSQQCHLLEIGELDIQLGHAYADAILHLLKSQNIEAAQIDAIGCHGQTLFHSPDSRYPFSMQIGNGNVIAEKTGITTICDFRQRDIVNGGQGAPLAPAFHKAVFHSSSESRVIVNIGGISNISILKQTFDSPVFGFDTGPGNTLMDSWIQKHLGQAFDDEGKWAEQGEVHQSLLNQLKADNYFTMKAPKSTGCELFNLDWLSRQIAAASARQLPPEDVQATLLAFTVWAIVEGIQQYAVEAEKVYVCGGGSRNTALMQKLQASLSPVSVESTIAIGMDPQWVEAAAFGWLAEQTLLHQKLDLRHVTGARYPSVLGAVYWSRKAS